MKKTLSVILALMLSMVLLSTALAAMPAEYIGEWAGSVGNINLSFNVSEDGTGTYTFEQSGYVENYDFYLAVESDTFTVDIPAANLLGIVSCEGTFTYADGVLTLAVQTTQAGGRVFEYTVPCQRVAELSGSILGSWQKISSHETGASTMSFTVDGICTIGSMEGPFVILDGNETEGYMECNPLPNIIVGYEFRVDGDTLYFSFPGEMDDAKVYERN